MAGRDLRVGVLADRPLVGEGDGYGTANSFDLDLASAFGRSLGVSVRFQAVDATDRLSALLNGRVDLVFASLVRTAEREQLVQFAGPYLEGKLVVATRTTWPSPAKRHSLCVAAGSAAEPAAARTDSVLIRGPSPGRCVSEVLAGRLDATAGDEILLRSHVSAAGGKLKLFPLAAYQPAQRYFIGVAPRDPYLKALVDSFLHASYIRGVDGVWQQAADRHLVAAGFTGLQPRPEGTMLRGAGDGPRPTSSPVAMKAVTTGTPPSRRRSRTIAHRRRRGTARRTVRLRTAATAVPVDPPAPSGEPAAAEASRQGPLSPGAWSLLFGVPVAVSALYLWIQSGGDRQFTLMLAQSVNPINFLAAVSLSVVWIFPAVPALLFTVGAVVLSSAVDRGGRQRLCDRYAVARWTARVPGWVVWCSIVAAAVSTPLVFAPAWALALCVARQRAVTGRQLPGARRLRWLALSASGAIVGLLVALALPAEPALALTIGWPVLLLVAGVDAPLHPARVVPFLRASAALAGLLALGVVHAVVTTPVLPSTALQIARAPVPSSTPGQTASDPDVAAADPPLRHLRGYLVSVDDEYTTVLSDAGGVETVRNDEVRSRISCPSLSDLPGDSATLLGLPLRESLLKALARQQRPSTLEDPRCIMRVDAPPDDRSETR
ncbi:substrate-binding periplasmic protein [Micromonospora sp. NPDC000442]|uniref:substrate-binding periplasmic protein n=1 Tax=Micromonospora sp. NPDC000442 TaxID=3364217 RepID=UPI0036AE9096